MMITPIFIPMGAGGSSGPDHTCPKCGHSWNNTNRSIPAFIKIIFIIAMLLIGFVLCIVADGIFFRGSYGNTLIISSADCTQQLPNNMKVVEDHGYYSIFINNGSKYLSYSLFGEVYDVVYDGSDHEMLLPITWYTNECAAKALAQKYIIQEQLKKDNIQKRRNQ